MNLYREIILVIFILVTGVDLLATRILGQKYKSIFTRLKP